VNTTDKVQEYLREWTFHYIKNKDLVRNNIIDIKEKFSDCDIFIEFKDKKQIILIEPILTNINETMLRLNKLKNELDAKYTAVVTLNNKENIKTVKDNWENLITDDGLSIYFVNPISDTQRIWIVFPKTHEKISDKNTLSVLAESVQEIDYKEIEKRL